MPSNTLPESANILHASGLLDAEHPYTELHLPDGRVVRLLTSWLQEGDAQKFAGADGADGTALLSKQALAAEHAPSNEDDRSYKDDQKYEANEILAEDGSLTIPLIEEQLQVGRRTVVTGKVLLQKSVHTFETQLDEPLAVRTFDVERIILNQPVESAPGVRQEGETTIYPLVEEQLILTKQLILKEEVRVTRRDTERRDTQTVTLRREHLAVEREVVS